MKKDVNSRLIASLAGVSRSTVSRVINNYPNVPEQTRKKVIEVIKRYEYYPNVSARVLKGKKTGTIGLFWVSENYSADDNLSNYTISSIIENAAEFGYLVLTCVVRNLEEESNIELVKEAFFQGRIDGGIFIGASSGEPLIEELIAKGFIVGVLDERLPEKFEKNRVVVNFANGTAERAVDYLVGLNHRKIAVINGTIKRYSGMQKSIGFLKGLNNYNLEVPASWIQNSDYTEKTGYSCMKYILGNSSELPTAVCCANDTIAFGAVKAINEFGLSVPKDISVIGIDDHVLSATFSPPLTTFKFDFKGVSQVITQSVLKVIRGEEQESLSYSFESEFVERDSCRRV